MIILDTNVLSELMRPKPFSQVAAWAGKPPADELFTTAITVAEMIYGIEILTKGKRREGLLAAAEAMFAEDLEGRTFDSEATRGFSRIATRHRAMGKPISHPDAQQRLLSCEAPGWQRATLPILLTAILISLIPGRPPETTCEAASPWHLRQQSVRVPLFLLLPCQ